MTQSRIKRPTYATPDEAVAKATQLVPGIRARVAQTDQLRRIPDETIHELIESGLFNLLVPRSMGGSELNYDALFSVTLALAEACPSTGWVYALLTGHMWLVAEFPEHVQAEVFDSPNPLTCSCVSTTGTPVRVDGGYRWTGSGLFCSGCDHSDWLLVMMATPNTDGTSERRWCLLPGADFTILDDWHTVGLRGTGSKTVVIDDAFIPDARVLRVTDLSNGVAPGATIHTGVLYGAAFEFAFSLPVPMPVVGIATGFLKTVRERIAKRIKGDNLVQAHEALGSLSRLALAEAQVESARVLISHDVRHYCFAPASNFTAVDKARCRRDTAYAAQLCRQAVNRLFEAAGGSGLYESSEMQRLWRDTNAAAAHHGLTWDIRGLEYARVMMGLPAQPEQSIL